MATHLVDNGGDLDSLARRSTRSGPTCSPASHRPSRPSRNRPSREPRNNCHTPPLASRLMPALELVTDLTPAGDQPEAIAALGGGHRAGRPVPDPARHHRVGQELHDRRGHREGAAAHASCSRPTRPSPPSSPASSGSSSRRTGSSTSSPTTTTTSPRRTSRPPTPTSRRTRRSTTRSTGCATRPPARSMSRRDVIIVASVSAIYGLGGPEEYARQCLILDVGEERDQRAILRPARRAAVRAQRLRLRPQQVPGARRHDRGVPGLRGAGRPHLALRRRGGAHRARSTRSPVRSSRSSTSSCCSRRRTTSPPTSA